MVEVEGYIGLIENFWCNDCGYDGEFMSDGESDEEETELLSIEEIREFIENMEVITNVDEMNKETLTLALHLYDTEHRKEWHKNQYHKTLNLLVKAYR